MRNRSFFFIPAHREEFVAKCFEFSCDRVIFDLEDSVPLAHKGQGLAAILAVEDKKSVRHIVRINKVETGYDSAEISALKGRFDLLLPKAENVAEISDVVAQIKDAPECRIWLLIETVLGFWNLKELVEAHSNILSGLIFGGEDYLASLDGAHIGGEKQFIHARMSLVHAARVKELICVDTPQLTFDNYVFLMEQYSESRGFGFDGALLIHPNQIDAANLAFGCSPREVEEALGIISAHKDAINLGHGIGKYKGKIVGPPMLARARNILRRFGPDVA